MLVMVSPDCASAVILATTNEVHLAPQEGIVGSDDRSLVEIAREVHAYGDER